MLIKDKIIKIRLFSLIFCLFLGGFFVFGSDVLAWTEPTAGPTGGNVAAPINVSGTSQIKTGNLTIGSASTNSLLQLYPKASDPSGECSDAADSGKIYYNSTDKQYKYCDGSSWNGLAGGAATGDYVKLNEENEGWTGLKPTSGLLALSAYAPSTLASGRSTGVYGTTASALSGGSGTYGVWGQAICNDNRCSGVFGSDTGLNSDAYAGYFHGDVKVENGDLFLGDGMWLGGVRRTDWPAGGTGEYWAQSNADTYILKKSSNLVVGGTSSADAKFYVKATNNGSVVIGQPGDLAKKPPETMYTCGDGVCNNGETNVTCAQDCPPDFSSPPGITVTNITETSAVIKWQSSKDHYGRVDYDTDIADNQWSYSRSTPGIVDAGTLASVTLNILTKNTTYSYRVVIWDIYGNYTYSETKTFRTLNSVYYCGDGICAVPETCQSCPPDCANKFASAGRCSISQWCMENDPTNPCDDLDGSIGGTSYDCCVYCLTSANCPANGKCCAPSYQCKKTCGPGESETGFGVGD